MHDEDMEEMQEYDMDGNPIMEEDENMQGEQMEDEYDEEEEEQEAKKNATEDDLSYEEFKNMIEM